MENLSFKNDYIKKGLRTFDNNELYVTTSRDDGITGQNYIIDAVNVIKDHGYVENNIGGASSKKPIKKTVVKKVVSTEPKYSSKTIVDINTIATEIIKELLDKKLYYYSPDDDSRLLSYIVTYLQRHNYHLDRTEHSFLVRYLRDNLFRTLVDGVRNRHSLTTVSDSNIANIRSFGMSGCGDGLQYIQKVAITREISNTWEGLSSLLDYPVTTGNRTPCNNSIHPLFFMLFANRIPGIEDLIVRSDYSTMIEEIKYKEVEPENAFLFLLRINDPAPLPTKDNNSLAPIANESLRMSISMMLRDIVLSIRSGNLNSEVSTHLENLLSNIKMPGSKFHEENMYQAIMATFSYTPTLITKGIKSLSFDPFQNFYGMGSAAKTIYQTPHAVYNIEYPVNDMYHFSDNSIPHLDDHNMDCVGYDPASNKVIFTYSSNKIVIENDQCNLLENIYRAMNTQTLQVDPNSVVTSFLARQPDLEMIYKNVVPVKVLMTNGLCVTIPREQTRMNSDPRNNIFFRPSMKPILNLSPVLIKQEIIMNKIRYTLTGALCYDVLSEGRSAQLDTLFNGSNIYTTSLSNKLGTFSLVKSGGLWFEYNPQDCITAERKRNKVERILERRFNKFTAAGGFADFETWKSEKIQEIRDNVNKNKNNFSDLVVSESYALDKISSNGCILLYSEDYDQYRMRVTEKYF